MVQLLAIKNVQGRLDRRVASLLDTVYRQKKLTDLKYCCRRILFIPYYYKKNTSVFSASFRFVTLSLNNASCYS